MVALIEKLTELFALVNTTASWPNNNHRPVNNENDTNNNDNINNNDDIDSNDNNNNNNNNNNSDDEKCKAWVAALIEKLTELLNNQPRNYEYQEIEARTKEGPAKSNIEKVNKSVMELMNRRRVSPAENPFAVCGSWPALSTQLLLPFYRWKARRKPRITVEPRILPERRKFLMRKRLNSVREYQLQRRWWRD